MANDAPTPPPAFSQGANIAARYASLSADAAKIEADLAASIAPLQAAADKKIAPIRVKLEKLKAEAAAWWAVHADAVRGKNKSAELAGCVLGMRQSSPKLLFAGGDDKAATKLLLSRRLLGLLVRVISPDKKAIVKRLKEEAEKPEENRQIAALGFSIEQTDTFFIEPATRTGRKS